MNRCYLIKVLLLFVLAIPRLSAQNGPNNCGEGTRINLTSGAVEAFTCAGDRRPDFLSFRSGLFYLPYAFLVTDQDENIIEVTTEFDIDFEKFPAGAYRVYAVYYKGQLLAKPGMNARKDVLANYCYGLTDNFVNVTHFTPNGGQVSFANSPSPRVVCANENVRETLVLRRINATPNYRFILTDSRNVIIRTLTDSTIAVADLALGLYRIHGFSFGGNYIAKAGNRVGVDALSSACGDLSDNFVEIQKIDPDGGTVTTADGRSSALVCAGNPLSFPLGMSRRNREPNAPYTYLITSPTNVIVRLGSANGVDFRDLPAGQYRVWGLSYGGSLTATIGAVAQGRLSSACSDLSDNFVTVNVFNQDAGQILLSTGDTTSSVCLNEPGPGTRSFVIRNASPGRKYYVVTDLSRRILTISTNTTINFRDLSGEQNLVWGVTADGALRARVGDNLSTVNFSDSCFAVTKVAVRIRRTNPTGGELKLSDGTTSQFLCFTNTTPRPKIVSNTGSGGDNYVYLVTDRQGMVQGLYPNNGTYNLSDLPVGEYRVYGLSYTGRLSFPEGANVRTSRFSDLCFDFSDNFITFIRSVNDGGRVNLNTGATSINLCGVNRDSTLVLATSTLLVQNYAYLLTDTFNRIIAISPTNQIRITGSPNGYFRVWGLGYSGDLTAKVGDNAASVSLSNQCFDLSDNFIAIAKRDVAAARLNYRGQPSALLCVGQDAPSVLTLTRENGFVGDGHALIVTDTLNRVLAFANGLAVSFSRTYPARFRVHGVAYTGNLRVRIGEPLGTVSSSECSAISPNFVTFNWNEVDAGRLTFANGATERLVCVDAAADILSFRSSSTVGGNFRYLLTDNQNRLLLTLVGNSLDFNVSPPGAYRVWGLSFTGNLQLQNGQSIIGQRLSDACFDLSDNFLTINSERLLAGNLAFDDGRNAKLVCKTGKPDTVSFAATNFSGGNQVFVITDGRGSILRGATANRLVVDNLNRDTLRIYSVTYTGNLSVQGGANISSAVLSSGCYAISSPITVSRIEFVGGLIRFSTGRSEAFQCPSTGVSTVAKFQRIGSNGDNFAYLITDPSNKILQVTTRDSFDFGNLAGGVYRIWGLTYSGKLLAQVGQQANTATLSDDCFSLTFNFITLNREIPDGGTLKLENGQTQSYVCSDNKKSDLLSWSISGNQQGQVAYLITTPTNGILRVQSVSAFEFDSLPVGDYRIWALVYNGNLLAKTGQVADKDNLASSCYALSKNFLTINKLKPEAGTIAATGLATTFCSGDGVRDLATFSLNGANQAPKLYLITDDKDQLIQVLRDSSRFDFDKLISGPARVYGLAYTGNLRLTPGKSIKDSLLSDDCYDLSDNFIAVTRPAVDGGKIRSQIAGDSIFVCLNDGKPDFYEFFNSSRSTLGYRYVLTNTSNIILSILDGDLQNLDLRGFRELRVWGVSFSGTFNETTNRDLRTTPASDGCYDLSDNFISVFLDAPDGGRISTTTNATDLRFCPGRDGSELQVRTTSRSRSGFVYVLTRRDSTIRQIVRGSRIDLRKEALGDYLLFGLSYTGALKIKAGDKLRTRDSLATNCFDLADNTMRITRGGEVEGGALTTADGKTTYSICPGDGIPDGIAVFPPSRTPEGSNYRVVITDERNRVVFPEVQSILIDFDRSPAGVYRVWGVSFTGTASIQFNQDITAGVLSSDCYDLSDNFITIISEKPLGGTISARNGATEVAVTKGDNVRDVVAFVRKDASRNAPYRYLITNEQNRIQQVMAVDSFDFGTLANGVYRVHGLAYTGTLLAKAGRLASNTDTLADNCFAVSANFVKITVNSTSLAPDEIVGNAKTDAQTSTPSLSLNQVLKLQAWPNPVATTLQVAYRYDDQRAAKGTLRLLHPSGALIQEQILEATPGQNQTQIDMSTLPQGWYLLELRVGGMREMAKIIK
jgi:hypothetical protein